MIRRCRGPCGKIETRQPRRSSAVVFYTCSECARLFPDTPEIKCTSIHVLHFGKTVLNLPKRNTALKETEEKQVDIPSWLKPAPIHNEYVKASEAKVFPNRFHIKDGYIIPDE